MGSSGRKSKDRVKHRTVLAILLQEICLQGALLKGKWHELSFSYNESRENITQSLRPDSAVIDSASIALTSLFL